jgi:hypothetical protein
MYTSTCKVPIIFVQLKIKLEFSRNILLNVSNTNFREYPSNVSRFMP